jgi:hypothetical protein
MQRDQNKTAPTAAKPGAPWVAPRLTRLEAGQAELVIGTVTDGPNKS